MASGIRKLSLRALPSARIRTTSTQSPRCTTRGCLRQIAISRHQFSTLSQAAWDLMGVKNPKGSRTCCYECHEVLMHNIVLSEDAFDELGKLFAGKEFEDRVRAAQQDFHDRPASGCFGLGSEFRRSAYGRSNTSSTRLNSTINDNGLPSGTSHAPVQPSEGDVTEAQHVACPASSRLRYQSCMSLMTCSVASLFVGFVYRPPAPLLANPLARSPGGWARHGAIFGVTKRDIEPVAWLNSLLLWKGVQIR